MDHLPVQPGSAQRQNPVTRRVAFTYWAHEDGPGISTAEATSVLQELFDANTIAYGIIGIERGSQAGEPPAALGDARLHFQGYLEFPSPVRLQAARRVLHQYLPGAHVEAAFAGGLQNRAYCVKEGDFVEIGTLGADRIRQGSAAGGDKFAERAREAIQLAREGRHEEIDMGMRLRFYNALRHFSHTLEEEAPPLDHQAGIWIYGPRGTYKTTTVEATLDAMEIPFYRKPAHKWWDGYSGQPAVVIDDIGIGDALALGDLLKQWLSGTPFIAEYKGGSQQIRPELVVITANVSPAEAYQSKPAWQYLDPILKRTVVVAVTRQSPMTPEKFVEAVNALPPITVPRVNVAALPASRILNRSRRAKRSADVPSITSEAPVTRYKGPASNTGDTQMTESATEPDGTGDQAVRHYRELDALDMRRAHAAGVARDYLEQKAEPDARRRLWEEQQDGALAIVQRHLWELHRVNTR